MFTDVLNNNCPKNFRKFEGHAFEGFYFLRIFG